jgi:cytochrome c peroxidase
MQVGDAKMAIKQVILAVCALMGSTAMAAPSGLPAPLTDDDFRPIDPAEAALGQLLFYDPILSGARDVACATCHHPRFGTADGLSLGLGDGGIGLGTDRVADKDNLPEERIPRNAPALFNLGIKDLRVLFHDGRIAVDDTRPGGIRTPLDEDMTAGFASLLSAQTMFPVLSPDEMAGHYTESDVARAVRQGVLTGQGGAWDLIARRVADIPAYAQMFRDVYPHVQRPDDIAFTDISNAIAVFMEDEWRSDNAPFDAVLRGQADLPPLAASGMDLFYGRAEVTGLPEDMFAFRTPSLRNVALTAPYGHAGSHADLAAFVADHADPVAALARYDAGQAVLPALDVEDDSIMSDPAEVAAIAAAVTTPPVVLSPNDVTALVAFLDSLTDPAAVKGRLGVPDAVPSGLVVP